MDNNNIPTLNQNFDIETFLEVLKKNIIYVILFIVIAIVGGYLYYRYTQPIFSSSSTIQIKKENKTSEFLGLSVVSDESKTESAVEILRSNEFLKNVIKTLPLEISFFTEGTFLYCENYGYNPFEVKYEITNDNVYNQPIYYEDNKDNSYTITLFNKEYKVKYNETTDLNGLKLCLSEPKRNDKEFNGTLEHHFFTINSDKKIIHDILTGLTIEIVNKNTGTIKISYECQNAVKSADITNAIAEEFIDFDIMKNRESTSATISYIDSQMDNLLEELSTLEAQIQQFKIQNGLLNDNTTDLKNNATESRISKLEQRVFDIEYEISALEEVKSEINNQEDLNIYEMLAMLSGQQSETFLSSMLKSLQDLISKRELLLFDVTESSHKIVVIDKQIESKKKTIVEFIGTSIERLKKEKVECQSKAHDIEKALITSNVYDEFEYAKLNRLYTVNESFYAQLLKSKAEILVTQAGYVSHNIVLEKASTPYYPIAPNLAKSEMMALILALVISLIFLLIRYLFFNKILSTNDISKYTEIPIIGEVVQHHHTSEHSQALVHRNSRSSLTECFRKIRTNLDFYPIDTDCRTIMTTSTVPSEGKTFIAINIADIYAMSGKKVLIVDLDLRKPRLDKCFNIQNEIGMTSILINKHSWRECVIHSEIENLDVITSGPLSPNAAELIINSNMEQFIKEIHQEYNVVVLDTPPMGIIHDAITLSKYANNIFYVMRSGFSVRNYIEFINDIKHKNNLKNLSIVLNGIVRKHSFGYGKYGYGKYGYGKYGYGKYGYGKYGYGYGTEGYGYGYTEDEESSKKKNFLNIFNKHKNSKQ